MTSPLVHIDGISKRFGDAVALENLSLDIAEGEFVTVLGPSGCGKSTTLRILGGFERPDTGRVILDGEDVTNQPPERRHVNMVFQDYALFPHMTVQQNISFALELKGMDKSAIKRRLDEIMSFLELDGFGDRYPGQLSGGQRQRVALARALAPDPALLLLDEPLGALDAKLRGQVQRELKSIQRQTHKTFFFVTHDQEEALTMSDRIVVKYQRHKPTSLHFYCQCSYTSHSLYINHIICSDTCTLLFIESTGSPSHGWLTVRPNQRLVFRRRLLLLGTSPAGLLRPCFRSRRSLGSYLCPVVIVQILVVLWFWQVFVAFDRHCSRCAAATKGGLIGCAESVPLASKIS